VSSLSRSELRRRWRERLKAFDEQQQTVKAFCAANSVSVAAFYKWRKKLADEQTQRFVPVEVRSPTFNRVATADGSSERLAVGGGPVAAVLRLGGDAVMEIASGQSDLIVSLAIALAGQSQASQLHAREAR
jgi:hypothetical protein